jgi:hypothetical protein
VSAKILDEPLLIRLRLGRDRLVGIIPASVDFFINFGNLPV